MSRKKLLINSPEFLTVTEATHPHYIIHSWINNYGLPNIRRYIYTWLPAVFNEKKWDEGQPNDLLWFYKQLLRTIEAAAIHLQLGGSKLSVINLDKMQFSVELLHPNLYCFANERDDPFNYFPRFLSKEEFVNPHLAFQSFFQFREISEWQMELEDMLHQALSNSCMEDYGYVIDLFGIGQQLHKFAEACQLIHVRNYDYVKNKFIKRTSPIPVARIIFERPEVRY